MIQFTTESARPKRNIFLFGPTSVGKGFTTSEIRKDHPDIPQVGMGDHFRRKRLEDERFEQMYGKMMDQGNLIPGLIVLSQAEPIIRGFAGKPIAVLDGVVRSVYQVDTFSRKGLLTDDDILCDINAELETCRRRHSHRMNSKGGGCRTDDVAFEDRYHRHQASRTQVINSVRNVGAQVVEVDGDKPLDEIAEAVKRIVRNCL